ncbi:hypothetical protein [Natranaerobius trueperi]|uniref:Uncharacterized protein n=1 Tax=Natranaerobius trueperi TaxID=759412 RepID=A0A226BY12_9FIRM|nr:hypothetical protein [Natranaerobius trueperi]OWZ83224.1 hypothetical protein CDO51_09590 [Natranaerobius trueperi]
MELIEKVKYSFIGMVLFAIMGLLLHMSIVNFNSSPLLITFGLIVASGILIYSSYKVITSE